MQTPIPLFPCGPMIRDGHPRPVSATSCTVLNGTVPAPVFPGGCAMRPPHAVYPSGMGSAYFAKKVDELRRIVSALYDKVNPDDLVHKVPGATEGSIPVFGPDGELVDSKTLMESLRETLSSDAAAIATIMEILTSRDEASRASALGIREMLDSMPDPEDMTQGEKTDFILKLVEYALVKEDLARTT